MVLISEPQANKNFITNLTKNPAKLSEINDIIFNIKEIEKKKARTSLNLDSKLVAEVKNVIIGNSTLTLSFVIEQALSVLLLLYSFHDLDPNHVSTQTEDEIEK
jgi:hypothetical protein